MWIIGYETGGFHSLIMDQPVVLAVWEITKFLVIRWIGVPPHVVKIPSQSFIGIKVTKLMGISILPHGTGIQLSSFPSNSFIREGGYIAFDIHACLIMYDKGHAFYPKHHTPSMFRCGYWLGRLTKGILLSSKFLLLLCSKSTSVSKTKFIQISLPKTKLLSHNYHLG